MATNSNLERWLDGEALDESLADHDAKYHGGHFDPKTMSCGKRDSQAKGDDPKLGGTEEKKKPETPEMDQEEYDEMYDYWSKRAATLPNDYLFGEVEEMEEKELLRGLGDYCWNHGVDESQWGYYHNLGRFNRDIEDHLYYVDPRYTAYKDEAERREKGGGTVSAQDAAAKEYLALCQDADSLRSQNSGKSRKFYPYAARKHADGSVCKAASPETCPFNKKAEKAETAITGKEKGDDTESKFNKMVDDGFYDKVRKEIDEILVGSPSGDPQDTRSINPNEIDDENIDEIGYDVMNSLGPKASESDVVRETAKKVSDKFAKEYLKDWQNKYFRLH